MQNLSKGMAQDRKDHVGEKDARGVLGDFAKRETQLPLAQDGAYDYVVESP